MPHSPVLGSALGCHGHIPACHRKPACAHVSVMYAHGILNCHLWSLSMTLLAASVMCMFCCRPRGLAHCALLFWPLPACCSLCSCVAASAIWLRLVPSGCVICPLVAPTALLLRLWSSKSLHPRYCLSSFNSSTSLLLAELTAPYACDG